MTIENHDEFLLDDSTVEREPEAIEPAVSEQDDKATKVAAAKQQRNKAFERFLKANPVLGLVGGNVDGSINDTQIAIAERLGGFRIKASGRNPEEVVFWDRQTGQALNPVEAMERVFADSPFLRSVEADALHSMRQDIASRTRDDAGRFVAPAAGGSGNGDGGNNNRSGGAPAVLHEFPVDPVLQSDDVNKVHRALRSFFEPDGKTPRVDPMDHTPEARRMKELLYSSRSTFPTGTLLSELSNRFHAAEKDRFARTVTPDGLAKLSDEEFNAITRSQRNTIISRHGLETWERLRSERTTARMRANENQDTLAKKFPTDDHWTLYWVRKGWDVEAARKRGAADRQRGRRLAGD